MNRLWPVYKDHLFFLQFFLSITAFTFSSIAACISLSKEICLPPWFPWRSHYGTMFSMVTWFSFSLVTGVSTISCSTLSVSILSRFFPKTFQHWYMCINRWPSLYLETNFWSVLMGLDLARAVSITDLATLFHNATVFYYRSSADDIILCCIIMYTAHWDMHV